MTPEKTPEPGDAWLSPQTFHFDQYTLPMCVQCRHFPLATLLPKPSRDLTKGVLNARS